MAKQNKKQPDITELKGAYGERIVEDNREVREGIKKRMKQILEKLDDVWQEKLASNFFDF